MEPLVLLVTPEPPVLLVTPEPPEPLELPDDGRRYIDEDTDWNYAPLDGEDTTNHNPCTTISDFMTAYAH